VFLVCGVALIAGESLLLTAEFATSEPRNYTRIEGDLWMGGRVAVPPGRTRAVLNLCEARDSYEAEFHRWDPIRDAEPAPSLDWLRSEVDFVDEQLRAGRTTYVHCAAGVSRSGMVVIAYLMRRHGWSRDEALVYVRTKRPDVRPNPAFMRLLAEWDEKLQSTR
jgi:hypothetical protein